MKIVKFSLQNIVFLLIMFVMYFFILYSIIFSIIFAITSLYVFDIYKYKKNKIEKHIHQEFLINSFIKNFALVSLSNNYNIVDSLKKSSVYITGDFKKNIDLCVNKIEEEYNYESAFRELAKKYPHNEVFREFLNNLLIIKEQSNIESSAKNIFNQSSLDSQKYIIQMDRKYNIKLDHFKNYLINTGIGLFVIYLIIFALNAYYIQFTNSISGIVINVTTIIISLVVTLKLINKTFEVKYE